MDTDGNIFDNTDFDSVARAVYRVIDDSPTQRMDFNATKNCPQVEEDLNDEDAYDGDEDDLGHELENYNKKRTKHVYHNLPGELAFDTADYDDDENAAHTSIVAKDKRYHYQNAAEATHEAENEEVLEQHWEAAVATTSDARKFPDESGRIKKLKIYNTKPIPATEKLQAYNSKDLSSSKDSVETVISSNVKIAKQQQPQPRSNTPFSREYKALQKSVNESKILTEFVTDTSEVKSRKLRRKKIAPRSSNLPTTPTAEHSYSSKLLGNAPKQTELGNELNIMIKKKKQHSRRFMPLKDESNIAASERTNVIKSRSSRSRSMHNNYSDNSNTFPESNKRSKSVQKYDTDSSSHSTYLKKWPSEESVLNVPKKSSSCKRTNMRSENSEFVQKQKEFLQQIKNSTQSSPQHRSRSGSADLDSEGRMAISKSKERHSKRLRDASAGDEYEQPQMQNENIDDAAATNSSVGTANTSAELESNGDNIEVLVTNVSQPPLKPGSDIFCWKCHDTNVNLACSKCMRSYHAACAKVKLDENMWLCPECVTLDSALNTTKRSRRNEPATDLLSQLLSFALSRMRFAKGHYNFHMPYEKNYSCKKIIINPVTLQTIHAKVENKEYRCVDEFVNDAKWLLHNAHILSFGNPTKTIAAAKSILKICRQEATEIETCAECYLNANTRPDWFVDVCSHPHLLLWAKLKGFPYWPAKAMGIGPHSLVNVKFFGEHDRAHVPIKDCFLYSLQDPNIQTGKKSARDLADCIKEVGEHIEKIIDRVGAFRYAEFKTPYDPADEMRQLETMMPGVQEFIKGQQNVTNNKPSLQFKIYKTADNNMSIIQKDLSGQNNGSETSSPLPQQQEHSEDANANVSIGSKKKKGFITPTSLGGSATDGEGKEKCLDSKIVKRDNYEVINKVTDDDNNSKLSPVILKRKANNGADIKKLNEEELKEICSPKLAKIDEKTLIEPSSVNSPTLKRKAESTGMENPKVKLGKYQEMRIPIVAIKNLNIIKDNSATENVVGHGIVIAQQILQQPQQEFAVAQNVVDNLVKNKPGVTMKIINKTAATATTHNIISSSTNPVNAKNTAHSNTALVNTLQSNITSSKLETSTPSPSTNNNKEKPPIPIKICTPTKKTKNTPDVQKQRDAVNDILKGLKPFVIKEEILSDKEEEIDETEPRYSHETSPVNKQTCSALQQTNVTQQINTAKQKSSAQEPIATKQINSVQQTNAIKPANTTQQTIATKQISSEQPLTLNPKKTLPLNNVTEKQNQPNNNNTPTPLPLNVKEEVLSDEEAIDDNAPLLPELAALNSNQTQKSLAAGSSNEVRVVGDTIIQKISVKNSALVQNNNNMSNSANNNSQKRSSLKGIPYGPLPASALPTTGVITPSNETANINSRAKKSFPRISPPISTNPPCITSSSSLITTQSMANQNAELNKRTMGRTTMVTIPVDYNNSTSDSSSMGIAIGMGMGMSAIPVPPLTAVSKMTCTGNANNSMAFQQNNATTSTVSTTLGSIITPISVTHNQATTTTNITSITTALTSVSTSTVATSKSPLNVMTMTACTSISSPTTSVNARKSPITAVAVNNNRATTSPLVTSNPKTVLTMSAPPPLAGLSGTSLINSTLITTIDSTGPVASTTTTMTSSNATGCQTESSTDSQLLSGFLMPTLATAMTDIMNRGPPTLTSRPKGPFQSEGHPMHNSQAGPVSKIFTENAHKITDYFISVMEDTMNEIAQGSESILQARLVLLEKELERTKQSYELQMAEMRRTSEIMRVSMENEKNRLANEIRKQCEAERMRSVEETKLKQWCAQCRREANFYCCWNTSYCGYLCQQLHWVKHSINCAQPRTSTMESSSSSNVTNSAPMNLELRSQNKSNNSSTCQNSPSVNFSSKPSSLATSHAKKDKTSVKPSSSNNTMPGSHLQTSASSLGSSRTNNSQSAEVLKLPSNTYLRPIGNTPLNTQALRCNTTYSTAVQRFSVPLPITTSVNISGGPQTFTILRQGSGWPVHMAGNNNSTIAAPVVNVPPPGQAHRNVGSTGGGSQMLAANKNSKTQTRYH